MRIVREIPVGLKLNGTYQLLDYADVNLLGGNANIIKKNTETIIDATKGVELVRNIEN
jgi:hypothetical protein